MKDIHMLESASNELNECLNYLEKHPTIAAYHLGFTKAIIAILLKAMKEDEEDGQED